MEEKLSELVNILSKKFSTTITTTSKKSEWKVNFPVPLELDPRFEYEIGMMFFSVYNAVNNITNENNSFMYDNKPYKILPGARELKNINECIQSLTGGQTKPDGKVDFNVIIEPDRPTSKCKLTTQADIKFITLGSVLGFDNLKVYKKGIHLSENRVNISDLSLINVECSIAKGGIISNTKNTHVTSNIIHSFPAHSVPPGYKYFEQRNPSIYFPIYTKNIQEITFKITDEDGNLINFNDEEISLGLHLKQV